MKTDPFEKTLAELEDEALVLMANSTNMKVTYLVSRMLDRLTRTYKILSEIDEGNNKGIARALDALDGYVETDQ